MRLVILLSCIYIAVLYCDTPSPEQQIAQAEQLHNKGELKAASQILLGLLQEVKGIPPWYPGACTDLAVNYHDLGQHDEAERWHLKARQTVVPNSLLHIQVLNNLASLYLETGQFGKAERIIGELTKMELPAGMPKVRTENTIASLHLARGRAREAEEMFVRVVAGWEDLGKHSEAAAALNNLGVLALERRDHRQALTYLQRAYDLWQQKIGKDHVMFVQTIANYGVALQVNGQADAAVKALSQAVSLAEKTYGANSRTSLQISLLYAGALEAAGNKKEAKNIQARVDKASAAFQSHTVDVLDLMRERR